jgi:DNA helicase-2/ATP-dependent DNA helicase PcrA
LKNFVQTWQTRPPQSSRKWPHEVPLIQLLYKLITWIPALQEDPEGLVYLEVITRTITQSARFISYNATIQRDSPHARYSIEAVLWGIFEPLASGAIDVDEELIEMLPRDRLNVLSIHQVKGLEFPLVIVDVSSDFKRKHWKQAFKRFPKNGSYPHNLEDMLRPFSPIGVPTRLALDRAFDDLIRQYFVAFSRPQDVLLLVGLGQPNNMPNQIPNVATGWTRDQQWQWQGLPNLIYV